MQAAFRRDRLRHPVRGQNRDRLNGAPGVDTAYGGNDNDGAVDQAFQIDGVTAANLLTATDFVWL